VHIDTSPFIDAYRNDTSKGKTGWPDIAKQLSWLDSVLAVSKAQWTIVVGHHPLFASTAKNGDQKELIEKVLPILQKHHVLFYICGHQHFLQYLRKENMHFLICGGGSSFWDPAPGKDVVFEKGSLGFLSVQITKNLFRADFINSEEKILYTVTVQN
jgi:acid phosphatase